MRIFRALIGPTTSAVTETPASACAPVVTLVPSTTRTAGRVTVSPSAPGSFSTSTTSPTATLCCLPPLRTIAYTAELTLCSFEDPAPRQRAARTGRAKAHRGSRVRSLAGPGQTVGYSVSAGDAAGAGRFAARFA